MGVDGIPEDHLKEFSQALAHPLCTIFNTAISSGRFHSRLTATRKCPVHKGGAKNDFMNYRPIAVLSCFSKVFEKCLYNIIYSYFSPLASNSQHGFVPLRSTVTNLLVITQFVCDAIAEGYQVDVIHTDFAKAFDTVCIRTLVARLVVLGLPGLFYLS